MQFKSIIYSFCAFSIGVISVFIWRLTGNSSHSKFPIEAPFGHTKNDPAGESTLPVEDSDNDKKVQITINKITCSVLSKLEKSHLFTLLSKEEVEEITKDLVELKKLVIPDESDWGSLQTAPEEHAEREISSFVSFQEIYVNSTNSTPSETNYIGDEDNLLQSALILCKKNSSAVRCRTFWTHQLGLENDLLYLAKLYCVRRGFESLSNEGTFVNKLKNSGKDILAKFFSSSIYNKTCVDSAMEAYDELVEYAGSCSPTNLRTELEIMGLVEFGLYDLLFDYIFMRLIEITESPPSILVKVIENRFLPSYIRDSAISAAAVSLLTLKRRFLNEEEGVVEFRRLFYSLAEKVVPLLACGLFGGESKLSSFCKRLKNGVNSMMVDIYKNDEAFADVNMLGSHISSVIDFNIYSILDYTLFLC